MYFLDSMRSERLGYAPTKVATFRIPYPTIKSGEIEVYVGKRNSKEIKSTIYHEFTHILGFHHNTKIDYQSLFNPSPMTLLKDSAGGKLAPTFDNFSNLDKAAIRIMYDSDVAIDPGLTREKFYRKIEEAKREMTK